MCVCCVVWPDNFIGDEGATALGPHLGKLVNMHTLNLASTHGLSCFVGVLWECWWSEFM